LVLEYLHQLGGDYLPLKKVLLMFAVAVEFSLVAGALQEQLVVLAVVIQLE
jgi:hypothetical protein